MRSGQLEKRRRIMRRSMALGHCICDPGKPCPCPLFRERNVCECAGERLPAPAGPVRLTEHVRGAGCASKIGKKDLAEVLGALPQIEDPRVLVGRAAGDDAGVVLLSGDTATILTVDVFAPSVDDPYAFGQIAAANSLSDVYAMAATPRTALSIIGFPVHTLPAGAMREILRGGIEKMAEAGVSVVGGHSIQDEEVKCGFAVVGTAPRDRFVTNAGARPGDAVVLTKPLGTGILAFAHQIGRASEGAMDAAAASMRALNRLAGERLLDCGAHAATDVTGFSLLGHMAEVVRNSGVEAEIDFDRVPLLEGAAGLARQEVLPGALERNREAVEEGMLDLAALAPAQRAVLFGPETSGGLLVFLPEKEAAGYVEGLHAGGVASARVIGRVTAEREGGFIRATTARASEFAPIAIEPERAPEPAPHAPPAAGAPAAAASCCPAGAPAESGEGPVAAAAAADAFQSYMAAVNAPGALGVREKKLISLALSVLAKCEPCVRIHTAAARGAGASEEEVAEAAALGIAFGGAPAAMFYSTLRAAQARPGAP